LSEGFVEVVDETQQPVREVFQSRETTAPHGPPMHDPKYDFNLIQPGAVFGCKHKPDMEFAFG
jgi:hypothetical protein